PLRAVVPHIHPELRRLRLLLRRLVRHRLASHHRLCRHTQSQNPNQVERVHAIESSKKCKNQRVVGPKPTVRIAGSSIIPTSIAEASPRLKPPHITTPFPLKKCTPKSSPSPLS